MPAKHIRPIAICILRNGDRLFVAECYDPTEKEVFYRPLGGAILFGEHGQECIKREIREEMKTEIKDLTYLGTMENIFVCDGKPGHEIVLVYQANFVDANFYQTESVKCQEDDGGEFIASWKPISFFREGKNPLYPEGLLDFLGKKVR